MRPHLGKMRPIWAICTKSGQKCSRIGQKKFNHHVQDVIAARAMTQMLKYPVNTDYYTLLHSTAYITSPVYLPALWITKCCSKLVYETLLGKEVVYVLRITFISGRRPVLEIQDHTVQLSQWLSQRCPSLQPRPCQDWFKQRGWRRLRMYIVNSWALGWSRDPGSAIKCSVRQSDICYYTLLHITLYYHFDHYYVLLRSLFLHCKYIIIISEYFGNYYTLSQNHYYILLHDYCIVITCQCLLHHYYVYCY